MFLAIMVGVACVLAVLSLCGAAAAITSCARLARSLETVARSYKDTDNAQLSAEVDDLRGALDVIRSSNQRQFGAVWKRIGLDQKADDVIPTVQTTNGDFQALLDLQSRPPVKPE